MKALFVIAAVLVSACVIGPVPTPVPPSGSAPAPSAVASSSPSAEAPSASAGASASPVASSITGCAPTDQDQYVYHPTRLVVLTPCIHMTGVIAAVRKEADGDEHILVKPDTAYANLVNAANSGLELGDLVVEPVCELTVTQADAQATCAADHTQLAIAGLAVGVHVWMEGRYVTDSSHGGWAELHPLYRWGVEPGLGIALPAQTPPPVTENEAP